MVFDAAERRFEYVGFWRRVLAAIIDFAITVAVMYIFCLIMKVDMTSLIGRNRDHLTPEMIKVKTLVNLFGGFFNFFYGVAMESSVLQATLGKLFVGAIVTDKKGERISLLRAFCRKLAKIISYLTFGLGYLMVALTDKKRALHDFIAGTQVIENYN